MCVAVLVPNEEVPRFISQELGPLAVRQSRGKVALQRGFLSQEPFVDSREGFARRVKTRRFTNGLVNRSFRAFDVDRRLRRRRQNQLRPQTRTAVRIEKVPEQKQVEMSRPV